MRWMIASVGLVAALVTWGMTAGQGRDAVVGKRLFGSGDWSKTGLRCWHCHADFNEKKTPDEYVRPGHPMFNVGFRSEFQAWDGRPLNTLEQAITTCMERWITERKEDSLVGEKAETHRVRQLVAYLQTEELSPERKSKPIDPDRATKLPSDRTLSVGDPSLGDGVFRRSCEHCHRHDGSGPGPSLLRNGYSRYQIGKKIRGIDNAGLRGLAMPPISKDRLSDREMLNVIAYVYQL